MSLTLPAVYSAASKQGNIQENWIVQLGFFNGDAQGKGDGGWDAILRSNGAANLLNEDLDHSEPDVNVDDATVLQAGDFIKVESEIMQILSISTHTLTVVRGAMGTTPATHDNDTAIYWNNFTPISLADTTVDSVFYHGTITNVPSIRSSIDLAKSTAKTGNISLNVVNFQFKGDDFSAELFLGTRKYINRNVKIYSQLNGDSTLANCLQVYQGRLIDISHDDSSIKLTLAEKRPWDFISIPQDKTDIKNIYEPIAYGNFTKNASTEGSPDYCTGTSLRPIPFIDYSQKKLWYVSGSDSVSSNADCHYYDENIDRFIPILSTDTATVSKYGAHCLSVPREMERTIKWKPSDVHSSGTNTFSSSASAFDKGLRSDAADDSTSGTAATKSNGATSDGANYYFLTLNSPEIEGSLDGTSDAYSLRIEVVWKITATALSGSPANSTIILYYRDTSDTWRSFGQITQAEGAGTESGTLKITYTDALNVTGDTVTNTTGYGGDLNVDGFWTNGIQIRTNFNKQSGGACTGTVYIYDVRLYTTTALTWGDKQAALNAVREKKYLYTGADGVDNSFTGGSNVADTGLEAHRDLLFRFTGFDDADGDIYNYDANLDIEAARITTAWNIRWWALEPVELKKILEQIQYEFGFIFKFRHDGTGSYWYVKDSYSSGNVTQTLKKDDIINLKINNTPFSELLTDMRIEYEKHPADDRYLSSLTSKDTTNDPRTKFNIQSKENIQEIKLDMNVNKPGNANPGGGDTNDGFADYYMNIFGDVKKIISCDIVNPAVSYNLETGDIIQFSNTAGEMPVEPFGDNWADYYMITDLQRSPGKIRIQAREVG